MRIHHPISSLLVLPPTAWAGKAGNALGDEGVPAARDAQRTLRTARQKLVALQRAEQGRRLTLFKALGGA